LLVARDHAESFARVAEGTADAFATDEVLLHGLIVHTGCAANSRWSAIFLSYDPTASCTARTISAGGSRQRDLPQLAKEGEIERQYKRWFLQRLPGRQHRTRRLARS
jgi:glutamate/aspartate transport system substrate-binding protein